MLRGGRVWFERVAHDADGRWEFNDRNQLSNTHRELAVVRERRALGALRARQVEAAFRRHHHVLMNAERDLIGSRYQDEQNHARRDEE